jgi:hypothetical protein
LRSRLAEPAQSLRSFTTAPGVAPEQNVVGVGVGEQIVRGKPTGVMAVKFFVRVKYRPRELSRSSLLPKQIFGRTTSYTVGQVKSPDTDVTVGYETGNYTFYEQIIIVGSGRQPFSAAGDSGSLILQRGTNRAVGLLFAGSSTHTIANHIGDVLQALKVTLA